MENRKNFLEQIKTKYQIKEPKDWGKMTTTQIHSAGGSALLTHYYEGSLFKCLSSVYKGSFYYFLQTHELEIHWKKEWFPYLPSAPKSYWKSVQNKKQFLETVKREYNIQEPSEWGKVKRKDIVRIGGATLLDNEGSLFRCLQSVYKGNLILKYISYRLEIEWKPGWFSSFSYWNSMNHRRQFMDELKVQFSIINPSDWGKLSTSNIKKAGGATLLSFYRDSLFLCLQDIYKGKVLLLPNI